MDKDAGSQETAVRAASSPHTASGGEGASSESPKKRRKVNHGKLCGLRQRTLGWKTFDTCADTQFSMHLLPTIGEPQHSQCYTTCLGIVLHLYTRLT
jgi:hypothetical protein